MKTLTPNSPTSQMTLELVREYCSKLSSQTGLIHGVDMSNRDYFIVYSQGGTGYKPVVFVGRGSGLVYLAQSWSKRTPNTWGRIRKLIALFPEVAS